jgi:mono/diheme cytochrome c family protein
VKYAIAIALCAVTALALAQPADDGPRRLEAPEDRIAAGKRGFVEVVKVLQSPRCMNCHPSGDRPLQGDRPHPHAQNISRRTIAAGVPCSTCHQERNADAIGIAGGPPGAPRWGLPPADMPMVFQGKTATQICEQMKDPAQNHGRSLADLLEHVSSDPLVLWGWSPGGKRTVPPLPHDRFVAAFRAWVDADGACP